MYEFLKIETLLIADFQIFHLKHFESLPWKLH